LPLIVGTVPGVVAGVLLLKRFDEFRSVLVIGVTMLVASVYFFLSETAADRRRGPERPPRDLRAADGLWIGLAQAVAGLMAGLSRSGLTIATGRLRRLNRPDAARFSFVLAPPIILGARAKALLDLRKAAGPAVSGSALLAGFAASAIVGYLAIEFMLKFVRRHSLRPFRRLSRGSRAPARPCREVPESPPVRATRLTRGPHPTMRPPRTGFGFRGRPVRGRVRTRIVP
jgi:undecaprenyl-diphosphatase